MSATKNEVVHINLHTLFNPTLGAMGMSRIGAKLALGFGECLIENDMVPYDILHGHN